MLPHKSRVDSGSDPVRCQAVCGLQNVKEGSADGNAMSRARNLLEMRGAEA